MFEYYKGDVVKTYTKKVTVTKDLFTNICGNCYRYAAGFACIAKVLGYDSRVAVGGVTSSSTRSYLSPHGWTEVKVDGKWYICDVSMARSSSGKSTYMRTESNYPYRHRCDNRYTLSTSNGKAVWK